MKDPTREVISITDVLPQRRYIDRDRFDIKALRQRTRFNVLRAMCKAEVK